MRENKHKNLLDKIKKEFEDSLENLDASTLSRLKRIRSEIFADKKKKRNEWISFSLGTIMAVCVVMAMLIFFQRGTIERHNNVEEIELLMSSESLEFYEELEFYEWLEFNELSG